MSENKRSTIRKFTNDYYLIIDEDTNELMGRIVDLTTDGFMIISDASIDIPQIVNCKMDFQRMIRFQKFMSFVAESKWCEFNEYCHWYETGFKISNISEENVEIIKEIIDEWDIKGAKKHSTIYNHNNDEMEYL